MPLGETHNLGDTVGSKPFDNTDLVSYLGQVPGLSGETAFPGSGAELAGMTTDDFVRRIMALLD